MLTTVLLIDDDLEEAHIFREALEEVNPRSACYYARSGPDALLKMETGEIMQPDIIFLDLSMPDMNGWDFLSLLKSNPRYEPIPVVIYTQSKWNADKPLPPGFLHYFVKPDNFESLKKIFRTVMLDIID